MRGIYEKDETIDARDTPMVICDKYVQGNICKILIKKKRPDAFFFIPRKVENRNADVIRLWYIDLECPVSVTGLRSF